MPASRDRCRWLVAVLLLSILPTAGWCQQAPATGQVPQALLELQATYQRVAAESIPKTVCLTADVRGRELAVGSGAVVSPDGLILTCAHVLEAAEQLGAATLTAVFPDGRRMDTRTRGRDSRRDFVLLQVEARELACFAWGNSSRLATGAWVLALGHPVGIVGVEGEGNQVPALSCGEVVSLEGSLQVFTGTGMKKYENAILTNVPLAFGNSGGPLVNIEGELVGINAAIGLGTAIRAYSVPSNLVVSVLERLKRSEELSRPPGGTADRFLEVLRALLQTTQVPQPASGEGDERLHRLGSGLHELVAPVRSYMAEVYRDGEKVGCGLVLDTDGNVATVRHVLRGEGGWDYLIHKLTDKLRENETLRELFGELLQRREPAYEVLVQRRVRLRARLVKEDPGRDLAFLNFSAGLLDFEFSTVPQPFVEELKKGSFVVSVGVEQGVDGIGLLSTRGHDIENIQAVPLNFVEILELLQRDATLLEARSFKKVLFHDAVVPNSRLGGAVIDLEGHLLGMNVFSPLRGASYAVPLSEILASFRDEGD